MTRDLRPAAVAGSWYPSAADVLGRDIDRYLAEATSAAVPTPQAIVSPHAGLMYSGHIAAHAFRSVVGASYSAVVLVGPSHFVDFAGVSIWPRGAWQTPFGEVPIAEHLAEEILKASPDVHDHRAAHGREHSLELQLPFIGHVLPGIPIVPLVMGRQTRATAFTLGETLATVTANVEGDVLLVASSDLSHFHDAHTASAMDDVVAGHVERLEAEGLMRALERQPHHACGGGPIVAVLDAAARRGSTRARVLKYGDSGDITGDKSSVVGYLAAAIW